MAPRKPWVLASLAALAAGAPLAAGFGGAEHAPHHAPHGLFEGDGEGEGEGEGEGDNFVNDPEGFVRFEAIINLAVYTDNHGKKLEKAGEELVDGSKWTVKIGEPFTQFDMEAGIQVPVENQHLDVHGRPVLIGTGKEREMPTPTPERPSLGDLIPVMMFQPIMNVKDVMFIRDTMQAVRNNFLSIPTFRAKKTPLIDAWRFTSKDPEEFAKRGRCHANLPEGTLCGAKVTLVAPATEVAGWVEGNEHEYIHEICMTLAHAISASADDGWDNKGGFIPWGLRARYAYLGAAHGWKHKGVFFGRPDEVTMQIDQCLMYYFDHEEDVMPPPPAPPGCIQCPPGPSSCSPQCCQKDVECFAFYDTFDSSTRADHRTPSP